ncbi:MAG: hypothetical protein ACJ70Z_04585 [Nitrososphaera sp.]
MSENTNDQGEIEKTGSQWAEVIGQLVDRMTGKGASVTYDFKDFEIDVPRAQGPGGKELGGAKWNINGTIAITWEAHEASEGPRQRASVSTVT